MTRTKSVKALLVVLMSAALIIAFMPQTAFTSYAATAKKVKSVTRSYPTTSSAYTMKVGQSKTFRVRLNPKNLKSTSKTTFWYTSKSSVGTLAKSKYSTKYKKYKGYYYAYTTVKAVKAGTTTVTAKSKYGKKVTWKITVKASTPVESVAISNMSTGSTSAIAVGDILKATATPSNVIATYQWSYVKADGTVTPIANATENTYKVSGSDVVGNTLQVAVTAGSKTVTAATTAKVTATAVSAVSITNASSVELSKTGATIAPVVGDVLTANATPGTADVTYQWYVANVAVSGATKSTYTVEKADVGKYIAVKVTGQNGYTGTQNVTAINVAAYNVADYATVKLATTAPYLLTDYTVAVNDKTKATVTTFGTLVTDYTVQWYQDSYSAATGAKNVACTGTGNATSLTYQADKADLGHKLVCVITGKGSYSGTVVSDATAAVTDTIASVQVTGTAAIGSTLTATATATKTGATGSGTPTVTYQWYRGSGSSQVAISGATSKTYKPTAEDIGYTLYCAVKGTGNFSGSVDSLATAKVAKGSVTVAIENTSGDVPAAGDTLKAAITPEDAIGSVSYQWYYGTTKTAATTMISGATAQTFTPQSTTATAANYVPAGSYVGCTVTVTTAGAALYTATGTAATDNAVKLGDKIKVTVANDHRLITHQTNVAGDKLTPTVTSDQTIALGTDYTITWYRNNSSNEIGTTDGTNITKGGTNATVAGLDATGAYTIQATDVGDTIYCVVNAKSTSTKVTGSVTAEKFAVTAPLTAVAITGDAKVGTELTATTTPSGATVTYQWYRVSGTTETAISGATKAKYTLTTADLGYNIEVKATPNGSYTGDAVKATTSSKVVGATLPAAIASGQYVNNQVGNKLSVSLTLDAFASASDVTYQWYRSSATTVASFDVSYATLITGATSADYTITADDATAGQSLYCVVSGADKGVYDSSKATYGFKITTGTPNYWTAL